MAHFMTINEILDAVRTEVNNKIANGKMKRDLVNNIEKSYSVWAENPNTASKAINNLFVEEFPEFA